MTKQESYIEFLKSKIAYTPETGLGIEVGLIEFKDGTRLKEHQRDAINWAIKGGRRALFESFGLGKTIQQLIICKTIIDYYKAKSILESDNDLYISQKGLIVCPLGVRGEFFNDAKKKLGIDLHYVRNMEEVEAAPENAICITNYERVRDGNIDPKFFIVTSLDEASVLRSFGSKTYQTFLDKFKGVPYKYVCTATPSPNKYKELIHYAGYLEVMDTGQALTRFFKRDSTKANNLTVHPHKEKEFWLWMSTWALFIIKPSDLGYSDEGYDLPELQTTYHMVNVDHSTVPAEDDGQTKMFRDAALGLKDAAREKRDSLDTRIQKMLEIINADRDSSYIIWHDLESERNAIMKALPKSEYNIAEVYGSQDMDIREKNIIDFSEGKIQYLATKPEISGQGCNFQYHCHKAIFLGIGYEFNNFIQAIHRIHRFQQIHTCEAHIIYAESESEILRALETKWKQHDYLVAQMTNIIKENGLSVTNSYDKMMRSLGLNRVEVSGKLWKAFNNDTVLETMSMQDNSIDLIHTSIPFSNHYEYTPSYNDFGHNDNNDRFFDQMDFLTPELLRVLKPGRVAAIHVKDRVLFGNTTGTGMPTIDPFHATTIFHYIKHGFQFMGMITVVTDVVRENNQTYRLGWSEQCKDGSKMGVGCPEYVLLFRKLPSDTSRAYADVPVAKSKKEYTRAHWQIDAHAFWKSSGNRLLSPADIHGLKLDQIRKLFRNMDEQFIYDYESHVEVAELMDEMGVLPASFMAVDPVSQSENVWDDVTRMLTLNSKQTKKNLENHICPLQFDIVRRVINRFSNVGETVYDPFGGIFTVPYIAVELGRIGMASELSSTYFRDGVSYMKEIENNVLAPTLFDLVDLEINDKTA